MTNQVAKIDNAIFLLTKTMLHADVISMTCVNFSICAGAFGLFIYDISTPVLFVYSVTAVLLSPKLNTFGFLLFSLILWEVLERLHEYRRNKFIASQ